MDNRTKESYKETLKEKMKAIADKSKRLKPLYEKADEVINHYEKYEQIIRNNMKKDARLLKEDDFLDHHKIAAAFCCSVMKARPIDYIPDDSGTALTRLEKTANEQCAFLFGLQVVEDFWEIKGKENISAEDKEIYNKCVMTPEPNDKQTFYNEWFEYLLNEEAFKHFDYENNKFGETLIFFIAHIYFMIESYSFQYYKNNG